MNERMYLYPVWIRVWHWSNAALFLLLILSGVSLHYADPSFPWIPFRVARSLHNVAGIVLAALYAAFIVGNVVTGGWRQYAPDLEGLARRMRRQAAYYLRGVFRGEEHPFDVTPARRYNPLQQVTYLGVMYVAVPLLVVTGLLLLFPEVAPERVLGAGGVWPVAVAHSVVAFLLTLFFIGHVYLAPMGASVLSGVRSMITGWHEPHEGHEQ